ncbi:MAG: phospholipase [Muribaculaceae bacterium]|nr:phospholipase [Muribaculaceae bacterium]
MVVALILLCSLLVAGCVLYLHHRLTGGDVAASDTSSSGAPSLSADEAEDGCCGMHITCERDSLLSSVSPEIEYFDDEELDRFAGRDGDMYEADEEEEFREILLTMPADNIAAWARSLQLRGINLPDAVREELLLIVSEAREARTLASAQGGD